MIDQRISHLRPGQDQTLMSFLHQAQVDAGYSDEGFANILLGAPLTDSRLAERRSFDWDILSRFFNATADELFGLSERSHYYRIRGASRGLILHQRAPWTKVSGYGAHCPCCLKESPHWRRSWLRPGAIVCERHGKVMVRHCCGCGGDLAEMTWSKPTPLCPRCSTDLSFSPVITAAPALIAHASAVRRDVDEILNTTPVDWNDVRLSRMAMIWRATRLMVADPHFVAMCAAFTNVRGMGMPDIGTTVHGRALTYAQCFTFVHFMSELCPDIFQHYWFATDSCAGFRDVDQSLLLKLAECADSFSLGETQTPAYGQLTMSFANWDGLNAIPSAA